MSYAGKEMNDGHEEKPSPDRRQQHDSDLEALLNPNFAPKMRAILAQVRMGSLDPEVALSQLLQMQTETASRDRKTGLLLGEAVVIKMTRLMEYSRRKRTPLVGGYFDVDKFKFVNDHPELGLGHSIGDEIIRRMAEALQETTRDEDIKVRLTEEHKGEDDSHQESQKARMGGDEFFIVLPMTNIDQANNVIHRFETRFSELSKPVLSAYEEITGSPLSLTVSRGIVQYDPVLDNSPQALIKRAELLMQQAKPRNNR